MRVAGQCIAVLAHTDMSQVTDNTGTCVQPSCEEEEENLALHLAKFSSSSSQQLMLMSTRPVNGMMHLEMPCHFFRSASASSAICTAAAIICGPAVMHHAVIG